MGLDKVVDSLVIVFVRMKIVVGHIDRVLLLWLACQLKQLSRVGSRHHRVTCSIHDKQRGGRDAVHNILCMHEQIFRVVQHLSAQPPGREM